MSQFGWQAGLSSMRHPGVGRRSHVMHCSSVGGTRCQVPDRPTGVVVALTVESAVVVTLVIGLISCDNLITIPTTFLDPQPAGRPTWADLRLPWPKRPLPHTH